jgi:cell division protein ZapA (FtsZ GTPase activity inhibitor)
MMTEKIEISILGKPMRVSAPGADELNGLQLAARALDAKMHVIRAQNQTMPIEKIAIMAALNTMHELLSLQAEKQHSEQTLQASLNRMQQLVDI